MHSVGDIVKGGSGGREKIKVEGFPDKEYSKKKTLLLQKNMRLWEIEKKLETLTDSVEKYIDSIEDSRKRNIMRYRYIDGIEENLQRHSKQPERRLKPHGSTEKQLESGCLIIERQLSVDWKELQQDL